MLIKVNDAGFDAQNGLALDSYESKCSISLVLFFYAG